MSASIWSPDGTIPSEAPPDYVYKRIWIDIAAGQTLVNFASVDPTFVYTPGLQSLEVGIDGGMPLQPVVDYTETSTQSITLVNPATDAGRLYAAVGRPITPSISGLDASLIPYTFPDNTVRSVQDLATSIGATGIGTQLAETNTVPTVLSIKLARSARDIFDWDPNAGTGGNDTDAFQAAWDAGARVLRPKPGRIFRIHTPIQIRPDLGPSFLNGCTIQAMVPMATVFDTGGTAGDDIHRKGHIYGDGAVINCANLADIGIWAKLFEFFGIEDIEVRNHKTRAFNFGLASGTRAYEAMLSRFRAFREISLGAAPSNSYSVYFENVGDSHISEGILQNSKYGLGGADLFDSKFTELHTWNNQEAGAMDRAFEISGGDNNFTSCQIDGPFLYGFDFANNSRRNALFGCNVNYGGQALDADNTATCVKLGTNTSLSVFGGAWKGDSVKRLKQDFEGDLTGLRVYGNEPVNCISTIGGDRGPNFIWAAVRFDNAATPVLEAPINVSSVTKIGTGNYRVNMTRDSGTAFQVTATAFKSAGTAALNCVEVARSAFTSEIKIFDNTNTLTDPDKVNFLAVRPA